MSLFDELFDRRSLYFDIFDGLIQAYVFVFLTSLFIKEAVEKEI